MAKNDNSSLGRAKKQKNDEFYTRRADVELELAHYKQHFKGNTDQSVALEADGTVWLEKFNLIESCTTNRQFNGWIRTIQ